MINLVTTRDQKYWPKEGENILMGPWCLPKNVVFDNHYNFRMIPPLFNESNREEVIQEIYRQYENMLHVVTQILNAYHNVLYSKRYWRILLGPYLFSFTNVIYERFVKINKALEFYSDLKLPILGKSCFVDIQDYNDFSGRIGADDLYNLQLITRIICIIKKGNNNFYYINEVNKNSRILTTFKRDNFNFFSRIRRKLYKNLNSFFSKRSSVLLYSSYLPELALAKLEIYSKGKISHFYPMLEDSVYYKKDESSRKNLLNIACLYSKESDFLNIALKILVDEIPTSFIECYKQKQQQTDEIFRSFAPKKIGSAMGWYNNDNFTMWAAQQSENGVELIGLQHGGNYGILKNHFSTIHELKISDIYYTWGWTNALKTCVPVPVSISLNVTQNTCNDKSILFVTTEHAIYYTDFLITPEDSFEYTRNQLRFIESCSKKILSYLNFRLYSDKPYWPIDEKLKKDFPKLNFDKKKKSFIETLSSCKLYVCDHLSTTYIQSLEINKPTILFWDPKKTVVNNQAKPFFDMLRKVNILHDTPENAAKWIKEVYDTLDDWWLSDRCQSAVNTFCEQFAKRSSTPIKDWSSALILKGKNLK